MYKTTIRPNGRRRIQTFNEEPSLTDQSFAAECDVGHIMKKFAKTGDMTLLQRKTGIYTDLSNIPDLLEATQVVETAKFAFDQLPSELREKFNNSPIGFVNFINDPNNYEKAKELGIFTQNDYDLMSQNKSHQKPAKSNDDLNDDLNAGKKSPSKKPTKPLADDSE